MPFKSATLWQAEKSCQPAEPFTGRADLLSPDDAYRVQLKVVKIRRELGHRIVGKKVGLVSKAMQELAGFNQPDYGHLFDQMRIEDHGGNTD
ncbi:MAG: hypothetical protein PVI90_13270 [Desulfobacteraceae bacterium]|jgi:2-keto-4-pentenoate hydratase